MTATVSDVLEGRSRWTVLSGDALAQLRELPSASVDALITDSPYSSGGAFRGDRTASTVTKYVHSGQLTVAPDFTGDNRDQRAFGYWCALWLAECLRIAKPGAIGALFTDWRQLPTTTDAFQAGGWVWRGIVPWDKTEAARPFIGRPRAQCEYVVWGSAGPLDERKDVGVLPGFHDVAPDASDDFEVPSFLRERVDVRDKWHIAGKPVGLMAKIARWCVQGGVILDPFCGSGSTGVGALREGRRFIGVELDPHWHALAAERLEAEESGSSLKASRAGQISLLGAQ